MNFDNIEIIHKLDRSNMLGEITNLPDQLMRAWETAGNFPLPEEKKYSNIIIAGMGGSAIGADVLAGYINPFCGIPLSVLRGYLLPKWAAGGEVLVICSSHSGNTEETLAVFEDAILNDCTVMSISTGGKLFNRSLAENKTAWKFTHEGQPRAAVGYSFGLLLNLFSRMDWIPDQFENLSEVVQSTKQFIKSIGEIIPAAQNQAKRIAGQALERIPVIFGAEHLEPVARRWKTQMNELAKCSAFFEFLPEADHNTLAGLVYPESSQQKFYTLFLDSEHYHQRNTKRIHLTCDEFMLAGFCTDKINFPKNTKLNEIWKLILLGDFVSFYLSIAYGVDPTPVEALQNLKQAMNK